jgi:hypothetical protein
VWVRGQVNVNVTYHPFYVERYDKVSIRDAQQTLCLIASFQWPDPSCCTTKKTEREELQFWRSVISTLELAWLWHHILHSEHVWHVKIRSRRLFFIEGMKISHISCFWDTFHNSPIYKSRKDSAYEKTLHCLKFQRSRLGNNSITKIIYKGFSWKVNRIITHNAGTFTSIIRRMIRAIVQQYVSAYGNSKTHIIINHEETKSPN